MSVPKPVPGRKYTAAQMEEMRKAYPTMVIPGHVMRIDADGMFSIVPEVQGASAFGRGKALQTAYRSKETVRELFPTEPIRKRTPQQRLDSLAGSMAEDAIRHGFPGLSEEKVSQLVGESWRRGRPVTAEQVRAAAATLLTEAEAKFNQTEAKKVTKTAPSD